MRNKRFGHAMVRIRPNVDNVAYLDFTIDKRYQPSFMTKQDQRYAELTKAKTQLLGGTKDKGWSVVAIMRNHGREKLVQGFEHYRVVIAKNGDWKWDPMYLDSSKVYRERTGFECLWG